VTKEGTDPLLSKEENIMNLIEPPTEDEVKHAITAPMRRMITVVSMDVVKSVLLFAYKCCR